MKGLFQSLVDWAQRSRFLRCLLLFLAVLGFCQGFLDLGAPTRLTGNEAEVFQTLDWVLYHSVRGDGVFPLWNPYLRTGLPYTADPMLHVYNPLVSLSVLAFGVRDGFKLAVFLSYITAALGMYQLAKSMGFSPLWRFWAALLFTFAGQPAARFFQGQYLFIFGFAWIPWIFWGLLRLLTINPTEALKSDRFVQIRHPVRFFIAVSAAALALLFFSGNAYYTFYMLLLVPLFGLIQVLWRQPWKTGGEVRTKSSSFIDLQRLIVVGLLALALAAIQLIPTAEFWPWIGKQTDVVGAHSPVQIFLDYVSRDTYRPDAYQALPAREEYYAYIGIWPFLALALFPLAWLHQGLRRHLRLIIFLLLVCVFAVLWINLDQAPWKQFFLDTHWLVQFRALLRVLIFGSMALIMLGGLTLQSIWQQLKDARDQLPTVALVGQIGMVLFFGLSVGDVFFTNRAYIHTQPISTVEYDVAAWLRGQNNRHDYVRINPNNGWHDALISNQLWAVEAWYHFVDIHPQKQDLTLRLIQARPVYLVQPPSENVDFYPDADWLGQVEGQNVYRLTQSLPMVFSVSADILSAGQGANPLTRPEVTEQDWKANNGNTIETVANAAAGDRLVVLYTAYPGWQLKIDDRPAELIVLDGYLAANMLAGVHKYKFMFQPTSFFLGLVISLAGLALVLFLFVTGLRFTRPSLHLKAIPWDSLRSLWYGLRRKAVRTEPAVSVVYTEGVLKPDSPVDLAEGQQVKVFIQSLPDNLSSAWRQWVWSSGGLARAALGAMKLESVLLGGALTVYLLVHMIGLTDWPIYFFTDEAVQTVMASDFLHQGLRNYDQEFLPTYFSNGPSFNLSSVTVYVQVLPYLLFGKSVFVTRMVSVLFSALGALFVALTLKNVFKVKQAWLGILILAVTPAWFLHSRTTFEPVEMSAFFAGFVYFYLRYRGDEPRYLFPAVLFGALVFYTYSPGQLIMAVAALLLFLVDLPYHLRQWRWLAWGVLFAVVLSLPYLRQMAAHPAALQEHLAQRAPYWLEQIPFIEKLWHYFQEYGRAFNPFYWFLPNESDLVRHLMKGYGHISLWILPFCLTGLLLVVTRLRQPDYRALLIALAAAPTGSALVQINITRSLVMLIPLTLLTCLGVYWWWEVISKLIKRRIPKAAAPESRRSAQPVVIFLILVGLSFYMLVDALWNGPLWYQDYTLVGMQYGASQLFGAVKQYAEMHPDSHLFVSPVWTNGTDVVKRFFVPDDLSVELGSVTGYLNQHLPVDDNLIFVLVPEEFQQVISSGKFKTMQVEQILNYPNGQPGFYFVRLSYVDTIDQILEAERAQRRKLLETDVTVEGQVVHVAYSALDIGQIESAFDGNETTLLRTLEANPMVIQVDFPEPRTMTGVKFYIGGTNAHLTVTLFTSNEPPAVFELEKQGSVADPRCEIEFGRTIDVQRLRLEMKDINQGEPGHTHLWEVQFVPLRK